MTFESHLEDLPEDAPWDEMPGELDVERGDTDAIPEREVSQEDLLASGDSPEDWLMYGGGYENQRHYPAEGITPENAADLELEYTLEPLEDENDFQGSPVIVGGDPPIMYVTFGPDILYVLNARTGETLWRATYEPVVGSSDETPPAERGVAVYGDTVYKSTLDLGVLALDRYTGEQRWYYNGAAAYREEVADTDEGMHEELMWERSRGTTSSFPPIVYDGILSKGSFGGEFGVSGFYDGVDLEDGTPAWRVNMTPDHEWVSDSWRHGGATAWAAAALDPVTGQIVVPSSNPGPWYGTIRPGYNPYSCGKVGIDARSGEYEWHYQDSPHDWWDYDSSAPPLVFEAEVDGEATRFATWPSKTGWVYTVNLETGQLHQRSEPYVQHLNMWSLPPFDDLDDAPWIMPELAGGTNPYHAGFDPESRTMVVKGFNRPMKFSWYQVEYEPGARYIGMDTVLAEPAEEDVEELEDPETETEIIEADEDPQLEEVDGEDDEDEDEGDDAQAEEEANGDDEEGADDGDDEEETEEEALAQEVPEAWNGFPGAVAGVDPLSGEVKWIEWTRPQDPPPRGGTLTMPTGVTFGGLGNGLFVAWETETGDRVAEYEIGDHGVDGDPAAWYDPGEGKHYVAITGGGGTHTDAEDGNTVAVFSIQE
ncbi:MAG: PQQ-binding-like beta-propeller repeat protein [Halolamina sp.]